MAQVLVGKKLSLVLLLWCASSPARGADGEWSPVYHPELTISRAAGPIRIDGAVDDAGWEGAARAMNFAEHNPGDQTRPDVDTEVLVAYDDDNLYVAWLCFDDPNQVRASFCERDRIFSDDYVILCLDPFGEATLAYEIAANPYGIPGDLLYSAAHGEDISYDMIFASKGRITEDGWVVEMAIPFAGLRFPKREEQVWRVDFWRNRPRGVRYQYSWAAYDRDQDCWPCQWGTVKGMTDVEPGAGLELLPSVVASQSGARTDEGGFENGKIKGEVGLGISYDISSEFTAEATINPDYSQIEADVAQIDVNTTFALFYPERRPFFQEGSDLFRTYFNTVYTRMINDPIAAGKVTGRTGKNSVAFLTARDEHSAIIVPLEEESAVFEDGKSFSNVLRARHDFGEQSHVGLVATDRRFDGGGSGSLVGIDGNIRISPRDGFRLQALAAHTHEKNDPALGDSAYQETRFDDGKYTAAFDGEKFWGHAFQAGFARNARNYWGGLEYWTWSPTFRADLGFEPRNNARRVNGWVGGILRFEDSEVLDNINGGLDGARQWNFEGVRKDEWINATLEVKFRAAQTGIHSRYLRSNELFGGIQFNDIWLAHTCFHTIPSAALRFGGNIDYGHRIARYDLVLGKELSYGFWTDVRPVDRFLISAQLNHVRSKDRNTGVELFSQSVFWSRFSLQISREFSLRLVLQYNDRYETWDADPLLTYRLNPLTVFYLGSTRDYRNLDLADDGREGWELQARQYFLKLQYLFQL